MDIGPVTAIRPISSIRHSPGVGDNLDVAGVFAAELRNQQRDESNPSRQPSRGLEDEEAEGEAEGLGSRPSQRRFRSESSISLFA